MAEEAKGGNPRLANTLQAGGALMKGIAGFQSGKTNARMARAEARAAERQGVALDDEIRAAARRAAGEAVAAMGANGGGLGTGSALDVLRDIEIESGIDRLRVKAEAYNRAGALRTQARLYKRQGAWSLLSSAMEAGSVAASGGGGAAGGGG